MDRYKIRCWYTSRNERRRRKGNKDECKHIASNWCTPYIGDTISSDAVGNQLEWREGKNRAHADAGTK